MCEYCQNGKDNKVWLVGSLTKWIYTDTYWGVSHYILRTVDIKNGETMGDYINTCPMCGRNLNEKLK
jgi:hypothetical protein